MKKKIRLVVCILLTSISVQGTMAQSWNITGNNNAASNSKLGSTTNVPIKFYTNNVQRMVLDSLGKVGIGTPTPLNILTIQLNGGSPAASWLAGSGSLPAFLALGENQATGFNLATAANSPAYRPVLNTRRSRGTLAAPAAVINNDYLASFVSSGYDGSSFQNPATIDFYVDGAPAQGNVPGRISFVTGSNAANRLERLKVGSTGNFNFNNDQLSITQATGYVGVGTAFPSARFDVAGGATNTTPVIRATNTFSGNEDVRGIVSYSKPADGWGYGIDATGGYIGGRFLSDAGAYAGTAYSVYAVASGSAGTRIANYDTSSGGTNNYGVYGTASGISNNYGVYGTSSGGTNNWGGYFPTKTYVSELRVGGVAGATGYVAAINGRLIATEVRVELVAKWPDYVFDKRYKLTPIENLESKINADKHLPGMPAATEVKENGIMLGEMQTKTIEKVEENTLYIIQLNNKIKLLEKEKTDENVLLNKKIQLLESKIEELIKTKK